MPQVDHRVGQRFKGIVDLGDELVANKNAPKFILPSKYTFDGAKTFLEDIRAEYALGSALGGLPATWVLINVGNHAAVEDRLAIGLAIVDAVQADDAPLKIDANSLGNVRQFWQGLAQQGGLIAVARGRYERRDHVAVTITKGNDLVTLDMLVPVKSNVVAALLGHGRRSVTVHDRCIDQIAIKKSLNSSRENGIEAAVVYPSAKRTVDARVVDFRLPICLLFNRQLFPLAPQVEQVQDVVEYLVQGQLDVRPPTAVREVWQDKFIKLSKAQTRWNPLPLLAFRHFEPQSRRILPDAAGFA